MKATLPSGYLLPKYIHFLLKKPTKRLLYFTGICWYLTGVCWYGTNAQVKNPEIPKHFGKTHNIKTAKTTDSLKRDSLKRKGIQDTVFQLDEVEVSTGYQTIPKERATGSFEVVTAKMLQHSATTDVLSRLEGITSSTIFVENDGAIVSNPPNTKILRIRGAAGFTANSWPLIVLDNFPYEGDVNNLNPNDISEITILKDAAAASVWGARAGGGVVVITTKKGLLNQPIQTEFSYNSSIASKPDIFYSPKLSTREFIDEERFLFAKGKYKSRINNRRTFPYLSPVVELLNQQQKGLIDSLEMERQIESFYGQDIRNDYSRYIYRPASKQQVSLQLKGGGKQLAYLFSAGYDDNKEHLVSTSYNRLTLRSEATFRPTDKFSLQTGMWYTHTQNRSLGMATSIDYGIGTFPIPYLSLVESPGKVKYTGMRFQTSYMDSLRNLGYLDWSQNPLDELGQSEANNIQNDLLINIGASYQLASWLRADLKYQHERSNGRLNDLQGEGSYATRDLINTFSTIENGQIKHYLPVGGWLRLVDEDLGVHQFRGQLNFSKEWSGKHRLDALAAAELRQSYGWNSTNSFYGYDPKTLSFSYIDPVNTYPTYTGGSNSLPYEVSFDDNRQRFVSVLANAAYTYDQRYTLSFSARKDASNLFGVSANRRGSPFWSAGAAWNIGNEDFFVNTLFELLKLRATYGYSGNTNNNVPAIPIISWQTPGSINQLPYVTAGTPPNPSLRWERVSTFNAGVDFALLRGRFSGSLEYYMRRPTDLIAYEPSDPSTGFLTLRRNSAILRVSGVDFLLNAVPLREADFEWSINFIFSYNKNTVSSYYNTYSNFSTTVLAGSPIEGLDRYALLAYRFLGLDHETGAPIGSLNGEPTMDYARIEAESMQADFVNVGPSSPPYFGSFRNTLSYQNVSISVNILYKLGYYFRRKGLNYQSLFNDNNGHSDFSRRWQKPGDEVSTNVPSIYYPADYLREQFYELSETLVEKGDHIRLQEVNLAYDFHFGRRTFKQLRLQANLQNLGMLWKANKLGLDPDLNTSLAIPLPFQITFGAHLTL